MSELTIDYEKFYEYFKELYGTGLEVVGWHLNGETKPFDDFFDSALDYASEPNVKELWFNFGDIPMNPETECIEVEWHGFPAGTHREDIWHWFEETFDVSVHDLMYM